MTIIRNMYQKDGNLSSEEHKCIANNLKADFIIVDLG